MEAGDWRLLPSPFTDIPSGGEFVAAQLVGTDTDRFIFGIAPANASAIRIAASCWSNGEFDVILLGIIC